MNVKIILVAMGCAAALAPAPGLAARGVLYDREEVLREFFPDANSVEAARIRLTPELAARLKTRLGYVPAIPVGVDSYPVWIGRRKDGGILGYAVIDDEIGMREPITFAVLIGPDGTVRRQEVMVYREAYGDGVTRSRFRRQFIGKTAKDPFRPGVDVQIVSGATISSRSMAVGVRRAVTIVEEALVGPGPATATEASAAARPLGRLADAGK